MDDETRTPTPDHDWISAAFLLAFVYSLANLLRAVNAPWYFFAVLWLFATKWLLILALRLPTSALPPTD